MKKMWKNVKKSQKTLFFRVFRKNRVLGPFWGRGGSRDLQKSTLPAMDARAKPNLHARMTVYLERPPPGVQNHKNGKKWEKNGKKCEKMLNYYNKVIKSFSKYNRIQ